VTVIMLTTRFLLPVTCALFLPLAAAAQTMAPAAPAMGCCGAMHQMPAAGDAAVDHSAHQAPDAAKPATPAMPAMPGMTAGAAGCCDAGKATAAPVAKMDCCAGMEATDAKPCEHCAAKAVAKPADKATDAPAPACCQHQAATDGCCG
jgi:hypothetical protein